MSSVKAVNLNIFGHTLADGVILLRTSVQKKYVYIHGVKGGKSIRRRYLHNAMVKVLAD